MNATATAHEVHTVSSQLGWSGLLALLLRAYRMGAGTYTGIEAVSNGLPILREPRVQTGRRTMAYMGASLAVTVFGLLVAYLLFRVEPVDGKTLNAVLLEKLTAAWPRGTGFGLVLTSFILVTLTVMKFHEGGWATLLVTGALVAAAFAIKRHYRNVTVQLRRLDAIVEAAESRAGLRPAPLTALDPRARTAIVLVNGYNGLGLHTTLNVSRLFGDTFRNFVFLSVGTVDAGNFKGAAKLAALRAHTAAEAERYAQWARAHGYGVATFTAITHDLTDEIMRLAQEAATQFPNRVFFAGQLLFARETRLTRLLHNTTAFALQRRFFLANLPFVILPISVGDPT